MKKSILVISVLAFTLAAIAMQSRIELRANMSPANSLGGRAKGHATWKTRDRSTQLQAELEVEGEKLARNADYLVTVGSNAPYEVTTDAFGAFNMEERFIGPNRPAVSVGDVVTVTDANNTVVLTGSFSPR